MNRKQKRLSIIAAGAVFLAGAAALVVAFWDRLSAMIS